MQHRDLRMHEARGDAADRLRRERDLGDEQDRALPAAHAFFKETDVDLRLARPRDAEDEVLRKLPKIAGNRGNRSRLLGGRLWRGRDVARARDEARLERGLLCRDEVTRRDQPLQRLDRRVARGLGEVGDLDRPRQGRKHIERLLLALGDLHGCRRRGREVDQRALHAPDRLAHRGRQDRRQRHPDRTRVVPADPPRELHEFAGQHDTRRIDAEDRLDLLARNPRVFAHRDAPHDPARGRRLAAPKRHLDARAVRQLREFARQRVGQPVGRPVDRPLDRDDDER